jgi:hypothetical protein
LVGIVVVELLVLLVASEVWNGGAFGEEGGGFFVNAFAFFAFGYVESS